MDGYFGIGGVMWHEIGHNRALGHVRGCPPVERFEDEYPLATANINVAGYRIVDGTAEIVSSDEYSDFMSYCGSPTSVSAYSYRKMAEYGFGLRPTLLSTRKVVP